MVRKRHDKDSKGNTRTITYIVKDVGFVYTSAPQPYHVLVPVPQQREPRAVLIFRELSEEVVCWDPI